MVYICCVAGCLNSSLKGFKLFHIPEGERNKRKRCQWLQRICKDKGDTHHMRICQIHFNDKDIVKSKCGKLKLLPNAVPRTHLPRKCDSNVPDFKFPDCPSSLTLNSSSPFLLHHFPAKQSIVCIDQDLEKHDICVNSKNCA
ncbi:uncharacterized protein LOC123013880 [Tribolium madens]|uniref:uncharacterized protein LOC123013880 n=1 Tax=Tribolium madens TaxID=41895 RepID=UPI001CF73C4E|nr:uncharacterized protein LOC123013880 [Tribolium madens]